MSYKRYYNSLKITSPKLLRPKCHIANNCTTYKQKITLKRNGSINAAELYKS